MAAITAGSSMLFAQGNDTVYLIRTAKPEKQTVSKATRITGSIVSPAEVKVSSRVSGRLLALDLFKDGGQVRLDEGVVVKKGDKIAEIDSRDYKAQLDAASAAVASAKASLKDAKREFDRADALFKDGTATAQERDKAEAAHEKAVAALSQAEAQMKIAEINLDECVIYAPMDGVVSKRSVEPGTLLSVGTELAVITKLDQLRFKMSVPTTLFSNLEPGKTHLSIEVDAYPGKPIETAISRVYPVASGDTRTLVVEATIDNGKGLYLPGMYAVGTIALDRRENAMVVPYESVIRNDKDRIVYVVENGIATAKLVKLGIRADAVVEVLEGLGYDDDIVVAGQHRLTNGVKVKVEAAGNLN